MIADHAYRFPQFVQTLRSSVFVDRSTQTLLVSLGKGDATVLFKNYPHFFRSRGDTTRPFLTYISGLTGGLYGSRAKHICDGRLLVRRCLFSWKHARSPDQIRLVCLDDDDDDGDNDGDGDGDGDSDSDDDGGNQGVPSVLRFASRSSRPSRKQEHTGDTFLDAYGAVVQLWSHPTWTGRSPAGWLAWSWSDRALERMGMPVLTCTGGEAQEAQEEAENKGRPCVVEHEGLPHDRTTEAMQALLSRAPSPEGTPAGPLEGPEDGASPCPSFMVPIVSADDLDLLLSLVSLCVAPIGLW